MRKKPAYFDSQASAAAVLKIDIYQLREAKAEGCLAFRSGRVYRDEFLAWLAERRRQGASLTKAKPGVGTIDNDDLREGVKEDDELPKSHWDRKKARLDYERAHYRFEVEKEKYLRTDEIETAVGQMLAGFRTALNMLPSSAARWVVGLRDFHDIKDKLQAEVDAVLQALGRSDSLEHITPAVVAKLFSDRDAQFRDELVRACDQVFQEIGRESLSDLLQRSLPLCSARQAAANGLQTTSDLFDKPVSKKL
jgi:hypothetical protein